MDSSASGASAASPGAAPPPGFGDLLRRHRLAAGLSQEALAEQAGLSARGVSDLERGLHRTPQRETVRLLARALGLLGEDAAALEGAISRRRGPGPPPAAPSDAGPAPAGGRTPEAGATAGTASPGARDLPTETVTFLFTDLEGSTRLLPAHSHAYRDAVARHHALLRGTVEAHGGVVFETVGDAVYAAFARPTDAVAAALAGQRALRAADWGELGVGALRARMGLHTGEVERQGMHYFGAPLYRCAWLTSTAHGGQTVLSAATAELVRDELAGGRLRDLGEHRLKDLARPEHVYQLLDPDLPSAFPPLAALDARRHNLPVQPTSFVGREREGVAIRKRLRRADVRLVTLTGPGGVGKTRLALHAATGVLDAFPGGVWFVSLAPLSDPAVVPSAIAQALGVGDARGRPLLDHLKDFLQSRRLLLVLDNCEHLLEGVASVVGALLEACPRLTVLATSREILHLAGERMYPTPPLRFPDRLAPARPPPLGVLTRCEAVALFVQRAAAAVPDFSLTAENGLAVAELCRRLDGIPLAIELAAARVKLLTPRAMLDRLERRLALLVGGPRDQPVRQQTLRATLDWGHDLLEAEERELFARLAVFSGGCTLEAAEAVCGAAGEPTVQPIEALASLVDKSLVQRREDPAGELRFEMLETVREYALEQLRQRGGLEETQRRHADYYLALVEAAEPLIMASDAAWLARLEQEHDNLRVALAWAGQDEAGVPLALRLAGAIGWFWYYRGYWEEGRRRFETTLRLPGAAPRTLARAKALFGVGGLAVLLGDPEGARLSLEESAAVSRQLQLDGQLALALSLLGLASLTEGRLAAAEVVIEDSVAVARRSDSRFATAFALNIAGDAAFAVGDLVRARALYEECLELSRGLGHRLGQANDLGDLARVARAQGDLARAQALNLESLDLARTLGNQRFAAKAVYNLGQVALDLKTPADATPHLGQALALFREIGDSLGQIECLEGLAVAVGNQGAVATATRWWRAAAAYRVVTRAPAVRPDERASWQLEPEPGAQAVAASDSPVPAFDAAVAEALTGGAAPGRDHRRQP